MEKTLLTVMCNHPKKTQIAHDIAAKTGLDVRTVFGLADMVNNSWCEIDEQTLDRFLDPKFYTLDVAVKLALAGLETLIPTSFYENEDFLQQANITRLPNYFAQNNANIPSFHVCEQICEIGAYAFAGAVNLTNITFGENEWLTFGKAAFRDCIHLKEISFPKTMPNLSEEMFKDCVSLASVELTKGVTGEIEKNAFRGCLSLQQISIHCFNGIIEEGAFDNCNALQKVNIFPLASIGKNAFRDCTQLTDIDLRGVDFLGEGTFRNSGLRTVSLSRKLYEIPDDCFCSCADLEQLIFYSGYGLKRIGKDAFFGCSKLKQISGKMYDFQFYQTDGLDELTQNITVDPDTPNADLTCDINCELNINDTLKTVL